MSSIHVVFTLVPGYTQNRRSISANNKTDYLLYEQLQVQLKSQNNSFLFLYLLLQRQLQSGTGHT